MDVCPAGCNVAIYNRMCIEREQRVDIEEIIADHRTTRDALLRDLEAGKKRAKIVVDLVEEAEEELEAFQVQRGGSAVGRWTCDLQVAGAIPAGPLSRNIGQLSLASLRGR